MTGSTTTTNERCSLFYNSSSKTNDPPVHFWGFLQGVGWNRWILASWGCLDSYDNVFMMMILHHHGYITRSIALWKEFLSLLLLL